MEAVGHNGWKHLHVERANDRPPCRWLRPSRPATHPQLRLVCFPHAGGSASTFFRFAQTLDQAIDVVAVQYPGRGERLMEPPLTDLDLKVAAICDALDTSDLPFAFLGLSFGSLVAFATARELRRRGQSAPVAMFLGGRIPPHLPATEAPLHELDDEAFLAALIRRYGDPDGMLADPEIVELVLPALRADVRASALWHYQHEAGLDVPLVAFAGRDDAEVRQHLGEWRHHTTGPFEELVVAGGHFVFAGDATEVKRAIESTALPGPPADNARPDRTQTFPTYRAITRVNISRMPQWAGVSSDIQQAVQVVSTVLPFRTNEYVMRELIDWDRVPDDPIFQLNFVQREMLPEADYRHIAELLAADRPRTEIEAAARAIRARMNPHPSGQMTHNVPTLDGRPLGGLQHKYRDTLLFFPSQGQTCHSYCTFCFRWGQFVAVDESRFEARQTADLAAYLRARPEITEVLVTGGDPLIMRVGALRRALAPLLEPDLRHLTIRLGTKSVANWPYRFTADADADELLRFFEQLAQQGRHLALMGHYNHPRELSTPAAQEAIRRIRATGAVIRMQSPLVRHVNDEPALWSELWSTGVRLGCVPYYMFVERDTGPHQYFEVPLERAWSVFQAAYQQVSGLARTVRGPVMSTLNGKVLIDGIVAAPEGKVFAMQFLQARNPNWVRRPFFAHYDPGATWFDQLTPALGTPPGLFGGPEDRSQPFEW